MEHEIIQSLFEITRARDTETLETNLVTTLAGLLPAREVAIINLLDEFRFEQCEFAVSVRIEPPAAPGGEPNYLWNNDRRPTELKGALKQAVENNTLTVCEEGNGTCSILVPVSDDVKPVCLLKIDGSTEELHAHKPTIESFAGIYGNFLRVLEDSQRDKLTGLLNRRTFDKKLARMLGVQRKITGDYSVSDRRVPSASEFAWLAIIDIDLFKSVNDEHGHIYGDEVILTLGQRMKHFFRNTDMLFRFGGEEFLVVLSPMSPDRAKMALDRFRDSVAAHVFQQIGGITVSIGFAKLVEQDYPPKVIDRADKALYYAKRNGRNQVAHYEHLVDAGEIIERPKPTGDIDLF